MTEPGSYGDTYASVYQAPEVARLTPSSDDVHAVIPTRAGGRPFTDATTPSADQVGRLAQQVAASVAGDLPAVLTETQIERARWVVSIGAASYVEAQFYPEQQGGSVAGGILWSRYTTELEKLKGSIASLGDDQPFSGTVSLRGR